MTTHLNPEFTRYGWLEFSMHRIVAMPVVLGLIFFIAGLGREPEESIATMAITAFMVLIGLWGGHKAAEAVLEEINDNTWDFQRLSSLSPWTLAWGKLLGSTSYTWYGGLIALVAYTATAMVHMPAHYVLSNVMIMVGSGLICHATALLSSLQAAQAKMASKGKLRVIGHHIIGMLAGLHFFFGGFISEHVYKRIQEGIKTAPTLEWYGMDYDLPSFYLCYTGVMLMWLVAGVYWQLRAQMRMRTGFWLWAQFMVFVILFYAGFDIDLEDGFRRGDGWREILEPHSFTAFMIAMLCLYGMTFLESWDGVSYRRLRQAWQAGRRDRFLELFPRWAVSLVITVVAGAVMIAAHKLALPALSLVLASLVFALRDIAILHYFRLHPQNRRATAATLFYLGILYILIPVLLAAMKLEVVMALFLPISFEDAHGGNFLSVVSGGVQAALATSLALHRWRQKWE